MKYLIQKVSLPKLGEDATNFTEVDAESGAKPKEANKSLYELLI